jgi:hypothetical protein
MEGHNFENLNIPQEEKPKKKSPWKSILAAAGIGAIAGMGINSMKEGLAEDQEIEQKRVAEISNTLNLSHIENQEAEKGFEEMFEYYLNNYFVRTDGKGKLKQDDRFEENNHSPASFRTQNRARALDIAIKSGIVKPEITGWQYLWEKIDFSPAMNIDTPPWDIHFGNTKVPFDENTYSSEELKKLKYVPFKSGVAY